MHGPADNTATLACRPQSGREELANALTHGVGLLLSITALALLAVRAGQYGDAWRIVGCSIFGTALVLLYASSTLYHALPPSRAKRFFRLADHVSIYVLIAGSYTPLTLGQLRGGWGWSLFGVVWGLAIAGILLKVIFRHRFEWLSIGLYLAMGWLGVVAIVPLCREFSLTALAWLFGGGFSYTGGVYFYLYDERPYYHTVWHLFVLVGSACHFFTMLFHVAPRT